MIKLYTCMQTLTANAISILTFMINSHISLISRKLWKDSIYFDYNWAWTFHASSITYQATNAGSMVCGTNRCYCIGFSGLGTSNSNEHPCCKKTCQDIASNMTSNFQCLLDDLLPNDDQVLLKGQWLALYSQWKLPAWCKHCQDRCFK